MTNLNSSTEFSLPSLDATKPDEYQKMVEQNNSHQELVKKIFLLGQAAGKINSLRTLINLGSVPNHMHEVDILRDPQNTLLPEHSRLLYTQIQNVLDRIGVRLSDAPVDMWDERNYSIGQDSPLSYRTTLRQTNVPGYVLRTEERKPASDTFWDISHIINARLVRE